MSQDKNGTAKCKCGEELVQTNTFPFWVYCQNPTCDYVQIIGDYWLDSMFGKFSENKFAKEGPFKGRYEGSPLGLTIQDIKKNYCPPEVVSQVDEKATCGTCEWMESGTGTCLKSGTSGWTSEGLWKVKETNPACESYSIKG